MSLFTVSVHAFSTETTGLSLTYVNQNQQKVIHVGLYDIFVTDSKLLFFDSNAVLKKTWDIPDMTDSSDKTNIDVINSTHIVVLYSYGLYGYGFTYVYNYILNVNNLAYSTYIWDNGGLGTTWVNTNVSQVILKLNNGYIYTAVNSYQANIHRTFVFRIIPTYAYIGYYANDVLYGVTFAFPSATDNTKSFIITKNTISGNRYKVWSVIPSSLTFTLIGTGGTDNDWSSYVYLFSYKYHAVDSGGYVYDVGVIFPLLGAYTTVLPQLIRFNATYLEEFYSPNYMPPSPMTIIRPLSVFFPLSGTPTNLVNGVYSWLFIGENYDLNIMSFGLYDLNTVSPSIEFTGDIQLYHIRKFYYQEINNGGGILDYDRNVLLEIDYTNNRAIADYVVWQGTGEGGGGEEGDYGGDFFASPTGSMFLITFFLVFLPPMMLGYEFSQKGANGLLGFLCGLAITTSIGYMSGFIPLWFLFIMFMVMIVIILSLLHGRGVF